jgi:nitrogen fixation protein FixH
MTLQETRMDDPSAEHSGFRLKGWMVLAILLVFFGVTFAVNFLMASLAISTFSGMQTDKPYETGLAYNKAIEQAKAQDSRGWVANVHLDRATPSETQMEVRLSDASGAPLTGLSLDAILRAPADSKRDHRVTLQESEAGFYRGTTTASAGQWDVALEAFRDQTIVYQSVNRVILH